MTPAILVFVYYAGAILLPIPGFWLLNKMTRPLPQDSEPVRKGHLRHKAVSQYRGMVYFMAISGFILMEIFWRMLFEFFIAYFQIHNALMNMS